jgi:hypothetical protein
MASNKRSLSAFKKRSDNWVRVCEHFNGIKFVVVENAFNRPLQRDSSFNTSDWVLVRWGTGPDNPTHLVDPETGVTEQLREYTDDEIRDLHNHVIKE